MDAIVKTDFCFPGQKSVYKGKVRDVYDINDEYLVMVVQTEFRPSTSYCRKECLTKGRY